MAAYILRRLALMIPTILGIMLISFTIIQFAPGGPVERIIAQLQGHDVGATARFAGGQSEMNNLSGGNLDGGSKYRGAQGLDPAFIEELEKQFGFAETGNCQCNPKLVCAGLLYVVRRIAFGLHLCNAIDSALKFFKA